MDDLQIRGWIEASRVARLMYEHDPSNAKALALDYLKKIQVSVEKGIAYVDRHDWQLANHSLQLDVVYCLTYSRTVLELMERDDWPKEQRRRVRGY